MTYTAIISFEAQSADVINVIFFTFSYTVKGRQNV